jgi:hypothetical protein
MVGVRGSIPLAPTISYNLLSTEKAKLFYFGFRADIQIQFGNEKRNGASTKTCNPCETRAFGCPSVPVAADTRRAVAVRALRPGKNTPLYAAALGTGACSRRFSKNKVLHYSSRQSSSGILPQSDVSSKVAISGAQRPRRRQGHRAAYSGNRPRHGDAYRQAHVERPGERRGTAAMPLRKAGGPIVGKLSGVTRDLDWRARAAFPEEWAAPRATPEQSQLTQSA